MRELALRIAAIEGAEHCLILPSGQAAIALLYLAFCKSGDHVLLTRSAYGPNTELAARPLKALGIEVERYDPMIGGGISELIRRNTRLIWTESPGSITMEVQDVPAICAAAHERGVMVAIDNTYGAGILFDAFAAGVDISVQALTKYAGGHSDLLLGSIATRDVKYDQQLREAQRLTGMGVSPDDCSMVLRGLKTLDVRLARLEQSALTVARWLYDRHEVKTMLHPAFADCPGHEIWKRDWNGSASIFSVIFGHWTASSCRIRPKKCSRTRSSRASRPDGPAAGKAGWRRAVASGRFAGQRATAIAVPKTRLQSNVKTS